ncbi:MAG: hypothetical protein M3Y43_01435 [Pseudomonadota bacterium]|nr:hypothetical protein [Pseudomonadota bacterium]MDQ2703806.1 hypothetical protein [Pseudomonadota bacterium]
MRNLLIGWALLAGATMVAPMQASGQDFELEIGRDGLRIERDCNPRREDCYRGERRGYHNDRPRCSERRALRKAERMGVRRARIADVGRRTIDVRGRDRHGERVYVTFGRHPSCPILS